MPELSQEEKARRGVIATLAYAILHTRPTDDNRNFIGVKTAIKMVSMPNLKLLLLSADRGIGVSPSIISSEILATPLNQNERAHIKNPFFAPKETVQAVVPTMIKEGLIIASPVMQKGVEKTQRLHLTQKGVEYLYNYDPAIAKKVAAILAMDISHLHPKTEEIALKPFAAEITNVETLARQGVHVHPGRPWLEIIVSATAPSGYPKH